MAEPKTIKELYEAILLVIEKRVNSVKNDKNKKQEIQKVRDYIQGKLQEESEEK